MAAARAAIGGSRRARWSALLLILIVLGAFAPWPVPVRGSGLLQARAMAAACAGSVATGLAPPAEGHALQAHEDAFVLDTPSLAASAAQSQARSLQLARQSAAAGFDPELRRDWRVRERQAEAQAQQVAVDSEAARYRLEAPGAGRLRDRDPDLRQGDWLGRRELLGRVVSAGPLQVVAYVPEDALPRLRAARRRASSPMAAPDRTWICACAASTRTPPACCRKRCCPPRRRRRTGARVAKPALPGTAGVPGDAGRGKRRSARPGAPAQLARPGQHPWRLGSSGARLRTAASVFWREAGF